MVSLPRISLLALCALTLFSSQVRAAPPPVHPEMEGRVMVGYQGWFGPGKENNWTHYGDNGEFKPGHVAVEMWPDMAEIPDDEKVPTDFRYADGSTAHVFDSGRAATVNRHFGWMRSYGIGGAWLQRFIGPVARDQKARARNDLVMNNVRAAARGNDVPWALMYDLSGVESDDVFSFVAEDWKRLVDAGIRQDPTYLTHQGRAAIALWGIGFNDNRPAPVVYLKLIDWLKNDPRYGGNAVVVGVPFWWRTGTRDAVSDASLKTVIEAADVIFPWPVGRYNSPDGAREVARTERAPDIEWARQHGKAYLPGIFPGFSWHNLMKTRGEDAPLDAIPRLDGEFLWAQAVSSQRAGATMLYVAMFDEIDEGTAIFKVSNRVPVGESPFLTTGDLPSDHYLWLTGEIAKMLRGELPASDAMPTR